MQPEAVAIKNNANKTRSLKGIYLVLSFIV